jgi:Thiol:disulfide interchange protein DsbD, N-terminal
MQKFLFVAVVLLSSELAFGQILTPVKWSFEAQKVSESEYDLIFKANIDNGWYVYSQYLESDEGPIATSFNFDENPRVEFVGKTKESGKKSEAYDSLFEMKVVKFSGKPVFTQRVKLRKGAVPVKGYLEYMTCDNTRCLPPTEVDFQFRLE